MKNCSSVHLSFPNDSAKSNLSQVFYTKHFQNGVLCLLKLNYKYIFFCINKSICRRQPSKVQPSGCEQKDLNVCLNVCDVTLKQKYRFYNHDITNRANELGK